MDEPVDVDAIGDGEAHAWPARVHNSGTGGQAASGIYEATFVKPPVQGI